MRSLWWIGLVIMLSACTSSWVGQVKNFLGKDSEAIALEKEVPFLEEIWVQEGLLGSGREEYAFSPLVSGDKAFLASYDGTVVALSDQKLLWKVVLPVSLSAGVGGNGRVLIVVSERGDVFALDAYDGRLLWSHMLRTSVLAVPSVAQDVVVLRGTDASVYAIGLLDGQLRWTFQQETLDVAIRSYAPLEVRDGLVAIGGDNGFVYLVDVQTGQVVWNALLEGADYTGTNRYDSSKMLVGFEGDLLCTVSYGGIAVCLNGDTGEEVWREVLSGGLSIRLAYPHLLFIDGNYTLEVRNITQKGIRWQYPESGALDPAFIPVLEGDRIAVLDRQARLHLIDRISGRINSVSTLEGIVGAVPYQKDWLVQTVDGRIARLAEPQISSGSLQ